MKGSTKALRLKKKEQRLCHCLSYGRIDPKKIDRLHKHRQRQMCSLKNVGPFSERQEATLTSTRRPNTNYKPLFPPISELPLSANPENCSPIYINEKDVSVSWKTSTECITENCRLKEAINEEGNRLSNVYDYKEINIRTQPQKLRLPKINTSSVVNQGV